jgi:hydrogenase nickel incorporation protein HypA/HybF
MHELSIAQSIVDTLEAQATAHNAAHVKGVRLRIGEASGIVIDSLTFCFEMLTDLDPALTGAQLSIEIAPHKARCGRCAQEFPIRDFVPQCPICEEWSNEIVSGTELQILEMEIA